MNQKSQIHAKTFVLVVALYSIGFGLDRLLEFLREANSTGRLFGSWYQMVTVSLANLLIAFCVFWLFARAFPALDRRALWLIAVFGLVMNFGPILYWLGLGSFMSVILAQRGYFLLAGAFTSVAALFVLYNRKRATA